MEKNTYIGRMKAMVYGHGLFSIEAAWFTSTFSTVHILTRMFKLNNFIIVDTFIKAAS